MQRRAFIIGALAWPLAASAQPYTVPVIGFLGTASASEWEPLVQAFRNGLAAGGYVEGRNVAIDYRWSGEAFGLLPAFAADLVQRRVAAIVATGSANSARAAQTASTTIPIVFVIGTDPVKLGLVASFNRPGGNLTGVSWLAAALGAKQMQLLSELLPGVRSVAALINPNNPVTETELIELRNAARALGRDIVALRAGNKPEIDAAFDTLVQERAGALVVSSDSVFLAHRDQIVALAARHRVPTIYPVYEFCAAGGLMCYGTRLADAYRQVGLYAARVLRGDAPADLPVQQATRVELFLNLKAANSLGLGFPLRLIARADEVIE